MLFPRRRLSCSVFGKRSWRAGSLTTLSLPCGGWRSALYFPYYWESPLVYGLANILTRARPLYRCSIFSVFFRPLPGYHLPYSGFISGTNPLSSLSSWLLFSPLRWPLWWPLQRFPVSIFALHMIIITMALNY